MQADEGALAILMAYYNNSWPASKDLTLKLFTNNVTPADTDTIATYTEASGGGYADQTLSNGSWTGAMVSGIATATHAVVSFPFTGALDGGASVYGYYAVDGNNKLIFSDLLAAPYTPAANKTILITPKHKLSKGTVS